MIKDSKTEWKDHSVDLGKGRANAQVERFEKSNSPCENFHKFSYSKILINNKKSKKS